MTNKVAIFENSKHMSGAFRSSLILANQLSERAEVLYILPADSTLNDAVAEHGFALRKVKTIEIRRSLKNLFLYFPMLLLNALILKSWLKKNRIDVLIVNDYHNLLGALVKLIGWRGRLITYIRRIPSQHHGLLGPLWVKIAQLCSESVIVVSKAVLNDLRSKRKTVVVNNTINSVEKYPVDKWPSFNSIVFLVIGNYMEGKGQLYALLAFLELPLESSIKIRFVGGDMGLKKNREYRNKLVRLAQQSKSCNRIEILGYDEDVERQVKDAHVVLNCATSESFSRVCIEAGYFGRAVISTKCGGPEEIIIPGRTGLLVKNRDPAEIAEAMSYFIDNKSSIEAMGEAARRHVREAFGYERQKLLTLQSILNEGYD